MAIRELLIAVTASTIFFGCDSNSPSNHTVDSSHVYWGEAVEGLRAGIAFKGVCHPIVLTSADMSDNTTPNLSVDNSYNNSKKMCANSFNVIIENNSLVQRQAPWESAGLTIQLSFQNEVGCEIISISAEKLFNEKLNGKWYMIGATHDDLQRVAMEIVRKQPKQRELSVNAVIKVHLRSSRPLENSEAHTKDINFTTGSLTIPFQVEAEMRSR